jgi:hypothetical protein
MEGPKSVMQDARRLLASHRLNYTSQGVHSLDILWWECPPEHWAYLRFGVSMNFMETPDPILEENNNKTESKLTIAVAFVTELISLGILALVPQGVFLMNVCPLSLVAKPEQPDQWRCIADMKKGHTQKSCASDPVRMTCPEDILPRIYPGGFSSVIDASTFFHMLLTVDEERQLMGLIHPETGDLYWYTRLPMGSSNSPAVSGRFGAAFLHIIFQEVEEMQGEVVINDWKVSLEGDKFDPKLGVGRVLIGSDGLPDCLIWIHVDDIFMNGTTREKCTSALKNILDLTVIVGSSHPPRYRSFVDSVENPKLRIPDNKVARALALLGLLMRGSKAVICRLALAVVVGTLQSLVLSTTNAIGASFLHHVYRNIHNENLDNFENIHDFYHSGLALGDLAQADFCWWEKALNSGPREQVQTRYFCTLGVAWGDGSGSGSGGTFEWVDSGKGALPKMEAWMGAWNGYIHSFTSNWREL